MIAVDENEQVNLTVRILKRNRVSVKDIAKFTKTTVPQARRILDTASLYYPVFEEKRGIYGLLVKEERKRGPRGFIARYRAEQGLPAN
jgi:hypothetical protein